MSEIITLPNLAALDIRDGGVLYRGGDQEWYADRWQRQAGCGPTNCANIIWYMAKTRRGCGPLCVYDASRKAGFIRLMEEVWSYVTPGGMGVNTTGIFANGAKRYGAEKGVPLTAEAITIPQLRCGGRDYAAAAEFISQALGSGLPVAFLNLSNGTLKNLDSWHWVTLVALRGDEAMIYDQGKELWIDLRQWMATSAMGGGFVALEVGFPAQA